MNKSVSFFQGSLRGHFSSTTILFNRLTPEYFLFICSRVVQNQLNEAAEECLVAGKGFSTILNEAVNMNNF